jgi:hypothetical protein
MGSVLLLHLRGTQVPSVKLRRPANSCVDRHNRTGRSRKRPASSNLHIAKSTRSEDRQVMSDDNAVDIAPQKRSANPLPGAPRRAAMSTSLSTRADYATLESQARVETKAG